MNKKILILILVFYFFLFSFSSLFSIEVGGHITEDTTWTPDNNPYIVIHDIYVNQGVTLTIAPGTIIKLNAAEFSWEHNEDFWWQGGEAVAKMFWVDGRIIAQGTEQDSIIFTRYQDIEYYRWGTIYLSPQSELSIFKYCKFEYSGKIGVSLTFQLPGALGTYNGKLYAENCVFIDNWYGILFVEPIESAFIKNNIFNTIEGSIDEYGHYVEFISIHTNQQPISVPLIAGNHFMNDNEGINCYNHYPVYVVDNTFTECYSGVKWLGGNMSSYIYNNLFINCEEGINNYEDTVYIKKNRFEEGGTGIVIDNGYAVIFDNFLDGCGINLYPYGSGKIYNNIVQNTGIGIQAYYGTYNICNNIVNNCGIGFAMNYTLISFNNNIGIDNNTAFSLNYSFSKIIGNSIILGSDIILEYNHGSPRFRNCLLDFELPDSCMDAGGNIWDDPLFVDASSGDFHLLPGSPCIDAGYDTTGYCPFDMDYNIRVWDGDSNGTSIIDIGPYEFEAPFIGGIAGQVFQYENGEPLDYVLLKINNQSNEFEFSDSVGCFEFNLPAGVYDIYAERVFYDDVVVEDIEVIEGEVTPLEFAMVTNVGVDENNELGITGYELMSNYPNPFSTSTTISFSATKLREDALIRIYNIKGQLVRQLSIFNSQLNWEQSSIVWDGKDERGNPVSSGIYFYKLKAGNRTATKKMLLVR